MARQFREQLEEEVQLEEARKKPMPPPAPPPPPQPPPPDTFSHAHPTDATGADTSPPPGAALSADERR